MVWLVRKPSWAQIPGLRVSSAMRCAIRLRSATSCTFLAKSWKEARVVDRVVVVVSRVHVERVLGHGPAGDVEHVGQSLAHGRIERLVHVGDALAAREVGRAEPRHAHPGHHAGGGVLALGLEEDQAAAVHVRRACGNRGGPALSHLGGGGDGIGAGRLAGGRLRADHGPTAIVGGEDPRVLHFAGLCVAHSFRISLHPLTLPSHEAPRRLGAFEPSSWAFSTQTIAPVGQRFVASGASSSCFV